MFISWKYFLNLSKNSKIQMAILLFLIAISAVFFESRFLPFQTIVFSVLSTVFVDLLLIKFRKIKKFLPSAAIVSGLIIGLLSDPSIPWYSIFAISVISMLSKNFLRLKNRHIFNPAAFGLFVAGLLFNNSVSWWAVSFQLPYINFGSFIFFLILLLPGYVSMIRMHRHKILAGFFTGYIVFLGVLNLYRQIFNFSSILGSTILDPTTIFFSLVMLPEPMSSPNKPVRQLLFGLTVGVASVLIGLIYANLKLDPFITSLLMANLIFFKFR